MSLTAPEIAAADEFNTGLSGEIAIEIQNDHIYDSDDEDNEISELSPTIEIETTYRFSKALSVFSQLTMESVGEPGPGKDYVFEDIGAFVEELTVNYDHHRFGLFAGKYTINFGLAWDEAPGIYGADLAEDYEFTERLGIGAYLLFGSDEIGEHRFEASAFFADTSFLSDSAFSKRGRLKLSDGGVSNTENFSSFSLALDGEKMPFAPGLHYHLGLVRQAKGRNDEKDETGLAIGLEYVLTPTEDLDITPLFEYVRLNDLDGEAGANTDFLTLGLGLEYDSWNAAIVYGYRDINGHDKADQGLQISAGYRFDNGFAIEAGWLGIEEDGTNSNTLGLLLSYTYVFGR